MHFKFNKMATFQDSNSKIDFNSNIAKIADLQAQDLTSIMALGIDCGTTV